MVYATCSIFGYTLDIYEHYQGQEAGEVARCMRRCQLLLIERIQAGLFFWHPLVGCPSNPKNGSLDGILLSGMISKECK